MRSPYRVALRWGGGTALWALALLAVGPLIGGSPIVEAAQVLIESSPGSLMQFAVTTFGEAAKPSAVLGVSVALVTAGALAGPLIHRLRSELRSTDAGAADGETAERESAPAETALPSPDGLTIAVGIAAVTLTAGSLLWAAEGPSPSWLLATGLALLPLGAPIAMRTQPVATERRRALRDVGVAVGTVGGAGILARTFRDEEPNTGPAPGEELGQFANKTDTGTTTPAGPGARVSETPATTAAGTATPRELDPGELETVRRNGPVTVSASGAEATFGFDFEGMPERVGDADSHYTVSKNLQEPDVDADGWSLTVDGVVDDPYELSYGDLVEHPDARDLTATMICISNSVGGELISTTTWRAIPVTALLSEAGVRDDVVDVATHAVDGFSEGIPWEVVKDRPEISIAFGMDDRTLPREHGFPARLLVPGRYGMKSTKWLDRIEATPEDQRSYYEERGWDEEGVVKTLAYTRAVQRRGDKVAIGGVAFAGLRGIDRVAVSVDGREEVADLEAAPSEFAWRRWKRVVDRPDSGRIDVVVRAVDGEGNIQPPEETPPGPDGSTGWHNVDVSL